MKYRTKLITIEAFKYDGDLMDKDGNFYVPSWVVEAYKTGTLFYGCGVGGDELFIEATPESVHRVGVGDYIVRSATGKIYPYKPDIFEQTYEEAENGKRGKRK